MNAIIPIPRCDVSIRPATLADLPFIDALQKQQSRNLGFMRMAALEGKVAAGNVLIAEEVKDQKSQIRQTPSSLASDLCPLTSVPVGYIIGTDKYLKREELGIIYQLNIAPSHRRSLVGATLVKAMFERAAYGCRLFCCWCAQDIEANLFWESLGFIPIAFRTGSERNRSARGQKGRVHIFWQRRIREGDATTPYWFPSQTSAGLIGADRLVLPIPPGTHWSDAKPIILPCGTGPVSSIFQCARRGARATKRPRVKEEVRKTIASNGLRLGEVSVAPRRKKKTSRGPRAKAKNDPLHVAAARELRDRYLEQFNGERFNGNEIGSNGKYDVTRSIESAPTAPPLLEQAA